MKTFSGFPAGKLAVTPIPNLFFTELLALIDDAAEFKITLYLFWRFAHSKTNFVRLAELLADRTLMQALKSEKGEPAKELRRALALAVEHGILLSLNFENENAATQEVYFLNTERGRRAFEKLQTTGLPKNSIEPEPASASARANIFALYEQNIGLLTPIIVEELKEAEELYPPEWIAEAFKRTVENNKRSWSYTRKILERWKTEGRGDQGKKKSWYDEYGKFVKR